ncbi:MAG: universal stress protein [Acidaminobacteraceae bacterium]
MDTEKTQCKDGVCMGINIFDSCDSHIQDINDPHKKKKDNIICEIKKNVQDFFRDNTQNISMKIINGNPAHQIMAVSKDQGFDLIIMSTHTVGAMKKFTLGSVTNKVVYNSEIPVLLIR